MITKSLSAWVLLGLGRFGPGGPLQMDLIILLRVPGPVLVCNSIPATVSNDTTEKGIENENAAAQFPVNRSHIKMIGDVFYQMS